MKCLQERRISIADISPNQWKLATIGLLIVIATVLITSLIIGRDTKVAPPEEIVQTKEADTQFAKKNRQTNLKQL